MKNTYLKPAAEYVNFNVEENIMYDLEDGLGGGMGVVSGMPDDWE